MLSVPYGALIEPKANELKSAEGSHEACLVFFAMNELFCPFSASLTSEKIAG